MRNILVSVSVGELVDKWTILAIKEIQIKDLTKVAMVRKEKSVLEASCREHGISLNDELTNELKEINTQLWDIEDRIRLKEKARAFDQEFIELARAVYITNDERFSTKSKINAKYGSEIQEVKSYEDYTTAP